LPSILVIDDNEQLVTAVRRYLERTGHAVSTADNGKAGIQAFRQQHTDVVIVDIHMPGQDGIETIMQLRAEYPDVRIIAISGGDHLHSVNALEDAQLLGANRTLQKPFDAATLVGAINAVLDAPA
jgi:DNA-binding response OmpR family regulator